MITTKRPQLLDFFIPSLREKIADFERGMKNGKPWGDMEANGRLGPVDQSTGEKGFKEKS